MAKYGRFLFWICVVCTIASIATHIYLTNHHYSLRYGGPTGDNLCNINETFNCNKTTTSRYSEVFGVSVAIYGALTHFVLLCLLLAVALPVAKPKMQEQLKTSIKIMGLGVFLVSLVMGSLSYFALNTICPMCSLSYVLSLIFLIAAWVNFRPLDFNFFQIKFLAACGAFILLFGFFFHHNTLRKYGGAEIEEITRLQLEQWQQSPTKNLDLVAPLTLNPSPDAKLKIVEFADFLCGHCAQAYPILHQFAEMHEDVEFSFQAFPLDGECNSAIGQSSGIPCLLARISQCSSEQGKTWETQEWIFSHQRDLLSLAAIKEQFQTHGPELGLDVEKLMICANENSTRKTIKGQAELGVAVGVKGTPSVYINGKKVPAGFNLRLLEQIYNQAR